jgi:hypothetical protein
MDTYRLQGHKLERELETNSMRVLVSEFTEEGTEFLAGIGWWR